MKNLYLAIIIVAGAITFGTVMAETFGATVINGKLTVNDGGFQFTRTDNTQTTMRLLNSDKQQAFQFEDPNDLQVYLLRSTEGPTGKFQFVDFSGASPTTRVDMSIERSNGNIGIGTASPVAKLDVNGNINLSGNITSSGDICIGECP